MAKNNINLQNKTYFKTCVHYYSTNIWLSSLTELFLFFWLSLNKQKHLLFANFILKLLFYFFKYYVKSIMKKTRSNNLNYS